MLLLSVFLIVLVFVQSAFLSINAVLAGILAVSFLSLSKKTLILAFALGLLIDILSLKIVGQTSLFYLLAIFSLSRYLQKFKKANYLYIIITGFLVFIIYSLVFFKKIDPINLFSEMALLLVFYTLNKRLIKTNKPSYD